MSDSTAVPVLLSELDPDDTTFMFRVLMKIDRLAASLATHGQDFPVVVRRQGEKLQLVCGFRRVAALRWLGESHVMAVVRELDDEAALRLAWSENEAREDYSDLDRAHAILKARAAGWTVKDLEALFDLSRPHMSRLCSLVELPAVVREALAEGQIRTTHAVVMGVADRKHAGFDAARWVEETVADGLSVRELRRRISGAHQEPVRAIVGFEKDNPHMVRIGRRSVRPRQMDDEELEQLIGEMETAVEFLRRYR